MNDIPDLDPFEARVRAAFVAPLPAAPSTLLERLDGVPVATVTPGRGRLWLILVPASLALMLVAVGLSSVGPRPSPTASPTRSTGLFEPVTVDAWEGAASIYDIWTIGEGFVAMVWGIDNHAERADLMRSDDGRRWDLVPPPRDGFVISAGGAVNGQVHVLGYTGTFDDPIWWHDALDRDGSWHELGQVAGIPASTHVIELTGAASGWLARIAVHEPAAENARAASQIRYSADGLRWTDPAVPEDQDAPSMYTGVGTDGSALLVFRYFDVDGYTRVQSIPKEVAPTEVLRSTDGATWEVNVVTPTGDGPRFMAYDGQRFVGIGRVPLGGEAGGSEAAVWFSDSSSTWHEGFLHRPAGAISESVRVVTASLQGGFTAVGSSEGEIWTSADGKTWQLMVVLGPGETWNPFGVAVLRNEIVVAGGGVDGKPTVWVRRPERGILQ